MGVLRERIETLEKENATLQRRMQIVERRSIGVRSKIRQIEALERYCQLINNKLTMLGIELDETVDESRPDSLDENEPCEPVGHFEEHQPDEWVKVEFFRFNSRSNVTEVLQSELGQRRWGCIIDINLSYPPPALKGTSAGHGETRHGAMITALKGLEDLIPEEFAPLLKAAIFGVGS